MCEVGCENQVARGLTSLHQQRSEALSLSRYTSSLGNAVSLQNKHTSHLLSALAHRRRPSGARHNVKNTEQKLATNFTWHVDGCSELQWMDVKTWRITLHDECRMCLGKASFNVTGNKEVGNIHNDYH